MANLTPIEQRLVKAVQHYQTNPIKKWKSQTKEVDAWFELAYQYMSERTLPKIKSNSESLIAYWPTYFLWGASSAHKRAFYEDRHYLYKMGTFGTGYTCLTVSNLYIVSLKQATELCPLFQQGMKGFLGDVLGRMAGEVNDRRRLLEDRAYTIPLTSVLDAQIVQDTDQQDAMAVRTANDQFLVYGHFNDTLEYLTTGVRMARMGMLTQGLDSQSTPKTQLAAASHTTDPLEQLRQLKQMLDSGLITMQEYEAKKADILSRM